MNIRFPPVPAFVRRAVLIAILALVVVGIVGVLAIPAAVRWGLETVATRELGRTVTVEQVRANPYTLRVTLRGLAIAGAAGETTPLLAVREITANASLMSLLRFAPVLDALTIDGADANIVRLDANTFNFSDIVDRIRAKPAAADAAESEPARFALNNIEVTDSRVSFDDRPAGRRHLADQIRLGIPFLSTLPSHAEITVQPAFHARLNGTAVAIDGETRPFADTLESLIHVKLDGLDIPTYVAYVPVRPNFTIPRGTLDTDLQIAFRRAVPATAEHPAQPARTLISGALGINGFALAAPATDAQPLVEWKSLRIALEELQPFDNHLTVADVALDGPVVHAARDAEGSLNWQRFGERPLQATPSAEPAAAGTSTGKPFTFTLKQARVTDGTLNVADDSAGQFRIQFVRFAAQASAMTNTSATRGKLQMSTDIADGGTVTAEGEVGLAPVGVRLQVAARSVALRAVARYLGNVMNATIDGSSDTDATVVFETGDQPALAIRDIRWHGTRLTARGPAGSDASLDLAAVDVDDALIDFLQRQATFGSLRLDGPNAIVKRLADGEINWVAVFRPPSKGNAPPRPDEPRAPDEKPWTVLIKEASIARGTVQLEDLAVKPAVKLRATAINGTARNLHADGSQRAELALSARLGRGGSLALEGGVRPRPLAAELRINAANLDAAALRPYVAERLNALLARAEVSARGRLDASQAGDGALQIGYRGGARLGNLHLLDAAGENDLLKWQVLDLSGIDVQMGRGVPRFAVDKAALSDFYARIIMSDQGRLNLADLVRTPGEPPVDLAAPRRPTGPVPPDERDKPAAEPGGAPSPDPARTAAADAAPRALIRIGHIAIARGNVNFTDNFIKPNYTANMTDLGGSVTTLASDSTEPATLALTGRIDDDAPLDISGRLQPLAPVLFLDIEGRTRGVDLPRLTPYSLKYAGYPIVKGKLTMEVKYKIEDRKLAANNHVYIDQLTLGERVDSPTATKLPVPLAVALLKNSRGEIDINLPVSGSLDDPEFSIGSLIVQVIVNLLTKAVTAPFSLLAAAFGGGEELGYVDFAAGSATLGHEQQKRVDTLAKALNDRPALKLDVVGHADPAVDTDGVLRDKLDAKLRAAKVRQMVRRGGESVDPAKVAIGPEERPALIAAVYDEEKIPDKPRNFIGMAKSIPAPEMEKLIVAHLAVTPEDLRALANRRATAVRDRLEDTGKVPRERVFVVEPQVGAGDAKAGAGAGTRVDFSLK